MITVGVAVRDQLPYVRRCLRSVARCQSRPTELVIVDDASAEPTASYLDCCAPQIGAKLLRNSRQLGYAPSANRILGAAKGDVVILLNSDTVVTAGWDDRLCGALERRPRAGLAGPSTSRSHTPQQLLEARFRWLDPTDEEIADYAGRIANQYGDTTEELLHLGGFCLAVSRSALQLLGPLDERFSPGPFDDNDYCDRAWAAGLKVLWAKGAYVHHFGGRSYQREYGDRYWDLYRAAKAQYLAKQRGSLGGANAPPSRGRNQETHE